VQKKGHSFRILIPAFAPLIVSFLATTGFAQITQTPVVRIARPVPVQVSRARPNVVRPAAPIAKANRVVVPQAKATTVQQLRLGPVVRNGGQQYIATYPYPLLRTPANEAWVNTNGSSVYDNAAIQNKNPGTRSLAGVKNQSKPNIGLIQLNNNRQNAQPLLSQRPTGPGRYNFQFSNNEVRSVQQALRRLGYYNGSTDGQLGADTQLAIETYQVKNNLPVTGMPSRPLYSELGIVN
jgi:peptidoglycan hydrolase-like protein with peptidoglycan-binding domain